MLPISTELHRYWRALVARRNTPERNDIDPGAIRMILSDAFMLDLDEAAGFPLRIAGSRVNALFMRELRGSSFLDLWREEDRGKVTSALHRALAEVCPYILRAKTGPPGLTALAVELVVLPLRHRDSAHSRMLGSVAVEHAPKWPGLISSMRIVLVSAEPLDAFATEIFEPHETRSFGVPLARPQGFGVSRNRR